MVVYATALSYRLAYYGHAGVCGPNRRHPPGGLRLQCTVIATLLVDSLSVYLFLLCLDHSLHVFYMYVIVQ